MASCSDSVPAGACCLARLQAIYHAYYDASWALQGFRQPDSKFFGIGAGPKSDACHRQFAADTAALIDTMVQNAASEAEAQTVLEYMITEPEQKQEDQLVYWMLLAVHGSAAPLCSLISSADASALCSTYDRLYPRRMRSPAQKALYKALHNRAAGR